MSEGNRICDHEGCDELQICGSLQAGGWEGYCKEHAAEHHMCWGCGRKSHGLWADADFVPYGVCSQCSVHFWPTKDRD